jgi:hypothetical protein
MITDDPLGAAGILYEIKLYLIMIMKREIKIRLGTVKVSETVRLCQRCYFTEDGIMHNRCSGLFRKQIYKLAV